MDACAIPFIQNCTERAREVLESNRCVGINNTFVHVLESVGELLCSSMTVMYGSATGSLKGQTFVGMLD